VEREAMFLSHLETNFNVLEAAFAGIFEKLLVVVGI
jgi:hypothetical protein